MTEIDPFPKRTRVSETEYGQFKRSPIANEVAYMMGSTMANALKNVVESLGDLTPAHKLLVLESAKQLFGL